MQEAFGIVIFAVVIVGGLIALLTFMSAGETYKQIGKGGLSLNEDAGRVDPRGAISSARASAEQEEEIRQMLEASNARRAARGQRPLDVDEEYRRLTGPAHDPALEAEVRQLVHARNARLVKRGRPPLDVEGEVARQLRELG